MIKIIHRFLRHQQGSILILVGVSIVVLVAMVGVGIDLGRQQIVSSKLQSASDAAALAAAAQPDGVDRDAAARRYFALNFPDSYLGVARPTPTVTISGDTIRVTATATAPTIFMGLLGINTITTDGRTGVGADTSTTSSDYDVIMVVDESGSTAQPCCGASSRMQVEKVALLQMLDVILPQNGTPNPNIRFGLVGYTGYVSNKWGLTSDPAQARSYISNLRPIYQNYDHFGLQAGLNMATGNWSGSNGQISLGFGTVQQNTDVPGAATLRADGRQLSDVRHVVFLTDGYIMLEPCGGYVCYEPFLEACEQVKSEGVILHTISFVSQSPGDVNALSSCASVDPATRQPRYYYAPDGDTLRNILTSISITINRTRIIE